MLSRSSVALALSLFVTLPAGTLFARSPADTEATPGTYPEIVRLSLVEGDVRVARGKDAEKVTGGSEWGVARADLPLSTGFSLATGTGHAEIELEDASTLYLGENSLLLFDQLETVAGAPKTAVTLVSGTATLHVHPVLPGETFSLSTAVGRINVPVGSTSYMRINSYLDGMQVTPQAKTSLVVDHAHTDAGTPGQVLTYGADGKVTESTPTADLTYSVWDSWTATRIRERTLALAAVMKEAKLSTPLPGIADLYGKGHFFDCAPYGTCWQPNEPGAATRPASFRRRAPGAPHLVRVAQYYGQGYSPYGTGYAAGGLLWDDALGFPCPIGGGGFLFGMDPLAYSSLYSDYGISPYSWGACHAGTWIHQNHRYAWVAGGTRHGLLPVHWLQYGSAKGFVPVHPDDQPGKPPLNLAYGVFAERAKGSPIERLSFNPATSIKPLGEAPKEFRGSALPTLARSEPPQLIAHALHAESGGARTGTPIVFEHHSGGFAVTHPVAVAGHAGMVTDHFGGTAGRIGGGEARGGMAGPGGSPGRLSGGSTGTVAPGGAMHGAMHGGGSSGSASSGGGGHK